MGLAPSRMPAEELVAFLTYQLGHIRHVSDLEYNFVLRGIADNKDDIKLKDGLRLPVWEYYLAQIRVADTTMLAVEKTTRAANTDEISKMVKETATPLDLGVTSLKDRILRDKKREHHPGRDFHGKGKSRPGRDRGQRDNKKPCPKDREGQ